MKIRFRRARDEDAGAIARLNARLAAAGLEHVVGGEPAGRPEPRLDERPVIDRMFVAADEAEEIRGAVWLREQLFSARGETVRAGWMIYPVSESLVDARFAGVPGTLLFGLLREQPRLMALGMGGEAGPFARLLAGARWSSQLVPFLFRLLRPGRVLRGLPRARTTRARRAAADLLALSGLAGLGHALAVSAPAALRARGATAGSATVAPRFGSWADDLWEAQRGRYGFAAVRDARALEALYPADFTPLTRLRVQRSGRDLGWVCTQAFDAAKSWLAPHFGELRVGIVTDAFASPEDALPVLAAGLRALADEGVDIVVTNQMHRAWRGAARALGFFAGPSTLAFSWSGAADALVAPVDEAHLTRSDGDGPQSASGV